MSEFVFVLKCFVVSVGLAFVLQVKISGMTIESKMDQFIRTSKVAGHLQDAAAGGAMLVQEAYFGAKGFIENSTQGSRKPESKSSK